MPYQAGGWDRNDTFETQPEIHRHGRCRSDQQQGLHGGRLVQLLAGWQVGALDSAHLATDMILPQAAGRG